VISVGSEFDPAQSACHDHSEEMAAVESHRRETIETHREKAVTGPGDVNGSPDSGS